MSNQVAYTLNNIFLFINIVSPFMLIFYFFCKIFFSKNNQTLELGRFFMYIIGTVISIVILYITRENIQIKNTPGMHKEYLCDIPFKFLSSANQYVAPHIISGILGYNFGYIVLSPSINANIYYSSIIMFLIAINSVVEKIYNCSSVYGIVLGLLLGLIIGLVYGLIIIGTDRRLMYMNGDCNNKKYKCELVS